MPKIEILARLGETAVLLPELIAEALAANDRAKLRLTLLQAAAAHVADPAAPTRSFETERRAARLDADVDQLVAGARALGEASLSAPGLGDAIEGLGSDIAAMLAPLSAAGAADASLGERVRALVAGMAHDGDAIAVAEIRRMTTARSDAPDSIHRLIMDLHRAINRLAADTAIDTVEGAQVHHLADADRARVRAFMRGLHRTGPLAFGHPGLGTTAASAGGRLTIQNDIGETDAHVLVAHVEALTVTLTYTDVHRRRARFFMNLFDGRMDWSPLAEQSGRGLGEDEAFYLVTGRYVAADDGSLLAFLELLGSRIVFLIDWNKARKALQTFVDRDEAIDLLEWSAANDLGHRAFLELGGPDLVLETIRRAAAGRVPYGVRLDGALGAAEARAFLKTVLRQASEGLTAGRSSRLIRDEIQADLAQRFETAEAAVLAILVRHLGLSRTLASDIAERLGGDPASRSRTPLAERARRLEAKADRLTLEAREICGRLQRAELARRVVDEVENAMDCLDECAFLLSLAGNAAFARKPLSQLAAVVEDGLSQMVRAAEAAARLPDARREDAVAALQAIDAVTAAEREADAAERAAIQAIMAPDSGGVDARAIVVALETARALETSTDHLAHASLALRERVLEELSA